MVSSQNRESLRISNFQCNKQGDGLDRVISAIDVVTHEEVVGLRRLAANLEELAQVMELAVDITADSHWRRHRLDVRLRDEDFLRLNLAG